MAVEFTCTNCGQLLGVEALPGQQVMCGACNSVVLVPESAGGPAGVQNPPGVSPAPFSPTDPPRDADTASAGALGYAPPPPLIRKGLAVSAMVFGLIGLVAFGCPPLILAGLTGIILGIIALVQATKSPQTHGGKGMAITGIVTGGVSLIIVPILAISIFLPALSRARETAKRTVCRANLRGIGQSLHIYANDNRDWFPPDLQTLIDTGLSAPQSFVCPSSGSTVGTFDYVYVPGLNEKARPNWIIAYEDPANHNGEGSVVLYVDSRAVFLSTAEFEVELQRVRAEIEAGEYGRHEWYRDFDW